MLRKRLRSSVSTCPFRIQHATFPADEMHPPTNELLPFGLKGSKGRRSQLRDGISGSSGKAEYVDFPLAVLAVSCGSQSYVEDERVRRNDIRTVFLNHTAETSRVTVP